MKQTEMKQRGLSATQLLLLPTTRSQSNSAHLNVTPGMIQNKQGQFFKVSRSFSSPSYAYRQGHHIKKFF